MDPHDTHHGAHDDPAAHLPDPSIWPLVVGLAFLAVGGAIVWWSRDRSNDFTGPLLGAAFVVALIAAAGWAYEDGRMKRKAEQGGGHGPRAPRYTQVMTFAVAEGELANARSENGVIAAIDRSELRNVEGFQDLRIVASPVEVGPTQVLVETTWSGREGLATYESTRDTLLDVVTQHSPQVVPGSVQVFDMEVVRDTKDVTFRFGMGAASALVGSVLVGGFMVGAGLTLFQSEGTGGEGGGGGGPAPVEDPYEVIATDNAFDSATLVAPPETEVTFTLVNRGQTIHNLSFYESAGGAVIHEGAPIAGGATGEETFTTPGPGSYYFVCDFHPTEMNGTFNVEEGAPPPGGAPAPGGGGAGGDSAYNVVSTDNDFDKATLVAPPNTEVTFTLTNEGQTIHNISFYESEGGAVIHEGAPVRGGQSGEETFTTPGVGSYFFVCDFHPNDMSGVFNVEEGAPPPGG